MPDRKRRKWANLTMSPLPSIQKRHRTLQRILCVGSEHPWPIIGSQLAKPANLDLSNVVIGPDSTVYRPAIWD